MRTRKMLIPALVLATAAIAQADTLEMQIRRARVSFKSEAPLETINGRTTRASGSFRVDPTNLSSASGTISVPVASLRTGIELRDEHLRGEDWLDAGSHPNATFEITGVSGASSLQPNQDANLTVRGNFTIHGVTKPVTARTRLQWDGGNRMRGRAQFTVKLDEHGVDIPAIVQAKVSNEITIRIDFQASS